MFEISISRNNIVTLVLILTYSYVSNIIEIFGIFLGEQLQYRNSYKESKVENNCSTSNLENEVCVKLYCIVWTIYRLYMLRLTEAIIVQIMHPHFEIHVYI